MNYINLSEGDEMQLVITLAIYQGGKGFFRETRLYHFF